MTSPADAPRPGSWLSAPPPAGAATTAPAATASDDLATRVLGVPVAGHVEVLAAEHERLHRLLASIDQL